MEESHKNEFRSDTAKYFYKLSLIAYYTGLPNFWIRQLDISKKTMDFNSIMSRFGTIIIYIFILLEIGAIFTQKKLSMKQESDVMIYVISHPMLWSYTINFSRKTEKVKKLVADFLEMKRLHNDPEVEKMMIRKSKIYTVLFVMICSVSMSMNTFEAIVQVVRKEGTFTTIITAWPLVDDTSASANIQRLLWNIVWWWMCTRVLSIYGFVFSLTCCISQQFIDLQVYFHSLNDLVFGDKRLNRKEQECKFEDTYIVGIKLQTDTLECVKQSQSICEWIFSSQIIFNILMLVTMMTQLLNTEITLVSAAAVGIAAFGTLTATGLFMCSAGDVTEEASKLGTAMFSSGWQHCTGASSIRVRKLVTTSIIFAQEPVLIKGLGIMHLSYSSYVSVVKSTYSAFSLLCQQSP